MRQSRLRSSSRTRRPWRAAGAALTLVLWAAGAAPAQDDEQAAAEESEVPEAVQSLEEGYARRIAVETEPVRGAYLESLARLKARLARDERLEDAVLVESYEKAVRERPEPSAIFEIEVPDAPPEIRPEAKRFAGRMESQIRPWRTRFIAELRKLEQQFTDGVRLADALSARTRREELEAEEETGLLPEKPRFEAREPQGNVALSQRGGVVKARMRPQDLIDGNTDQYDDKGGWGACPIPGSLTLELAHVYALSEVRLFLWNATGNRSYRFRVHVSPDGEDWDEVADYSRKWGAGEVVIPFDTAPVRFVWVEGLENSEGYPWLHVVEIEAR